MNVVFTRLPRNPRSRTSSLPASITCARACCGDIGSVTPSPHPTVTPANSNAPITCLQRVPNPHAPSSVPNDGDCLERADPLGG